MRTERIETGLQQRIWSFNRPGQQPARQLVMITDGFGEIETKDVRMALTAPTVAWLGGLEQGRLRVDAGASGHRAWTDDETLASAIGEQAESAALAALSNRDFTLSLTGFPDQAGAIERCLAAAAAERSERRPGSPLLVSALLRIVLVLLLRVAGGDDAPQPSTGERLALLQRFRQLVEMNFRSHWSVRQYADALSISTDRLHAICQAGVGKPPKALVSERLAHEAAMRLERSSLTIEQLGHLLGFGDPAHFSNFFNRMRGMPPGRYRRMVAQANADGRRTQASGFADWP